MASAVIYYNAYILSALLENAQTQAEIDFICQFSPVAWSHINFLGRYEFDQKYTLADINKWIKDINVNPKKFRV